jgi:hypothetical protein
MQSQATTVDQYIAELPSDRREAIAKIRAVILKNLPKHLEEGMQYGMIGYYVPHSVYPPGYHCDPKQPLPFAGLASQKNYMSLYLGNLYADDGQLVDFQAAWNAAGKKLDMGKVCIRFKRLDDIPLQVIGDALKRASVRRHIEMYEKVRDFAPERRGERKAAGIKKSAELKGGKLKAAKQKVAKKSATKKATPKRQRSRQSPRGRRASVRADAAPPPGECDDHAVRRRHRENAVQPPPTTDTNSSGVASGTAVTVSVTLCPARPPAKFSPLTVSA